MTLPLAVLVSVLYAQAPAGLQVISATKSAVALNWNAVPGATSYQVERRIEPAPWAAVGTPTSETSATDSKIDPYATYNYRVKAVGSPAASNERTVGPPPAGYNVAVSAPPTREADFAQRLTMALDSNGDPICAYIFRDPNRTGKPEENTLHFVGWDRANYRWRKPLQVDVIGRVPQFGMVISLASRRQRRVNLLLASVREGRLPAVAVSNYDGVTWNMQTVAPLKGEWDALACTVALPNGVIHLAYFTPIGPRHITGRTSDEADRWTDFPIPPRDHNSQRAIGHMALDGSGQPVIVYLAAGLPKGVSVNYWRPGSAPLQALDTNGMQNDAPDIRIAFYGTKPRLLLAGFRDIVSTHNIWFSCFRDDGAVWTEPVVVPNDGNRGMAGPLTLAIDSKGSLAVSSRDGGGNYSGMKCGWPKLSLSSDGRQWRTCSPNPKDLKNLANFINAAYAGNDKLYLTWRSTGPMNAVVVWHEGAYCPPRIFRFISSRLPVQSKANRPPATDALPCHDYRNLI